MSSSSAITEVRQNDQDAVQGMKLKLMVDKVQNRVVFAEVNYEFMDILLSFLTLPLGTIVKLLEQDINHIGSLHRIYASVSSLEANHFRTSLCKTMLLSPKNASEAQCKNLKININPFPEQDGKLYLCNSCSRFSIYPVEKCGNCNRYNISGITVQGEKSRCGDGVFVKGGASTFMITDDLQIFPSSTATVIALVKRLEIDDSHKLEEMIVEIRSNEVLQLLRYSLLSKSTFTNTFLRKKCVIDTVKFEFIEADNSEKNNSTENSSMTMKLLIRKYDERVLYAEAGVEVVDFIFSFLTFPLGTVIKLTGESSGLGCIDNLYKGVARELSTTHCIKSEGYKLRLLSPILFPHFGFENHPLQMNEYMQCRVKFIQEKGESSAVFVDPKSPTEETDSGKGYLKNSAKFMITDDLVVTHLSPITCVARLNQLNVSIKDVKERSVTIGKEEALNMLRASLVSKYVLSDVFNWRDSYPEYWHAEDLSLEGLNCIGWFTTMCQPMFWAGWK